MQPRLPFEKIPSLLDMNKQLAILNNKIDELIRQNKLYLLARSDVEIEEKITTGTKEIPANDEEVVLTIPDRKCAIGDIVIQISNETTGTNGASYTGFREFIHGDIIDRGTIYENFQKGYTFPRQGIYISYIDMIRGNFTYHYANLNKMTLRVSDREYRLILYNDDDVAHTMTYTVEIIYLDDPELTKDKEGKQAGVK